MTDELKTEKKTRKRRVQPKKTTESKPFKEEKKNYSTLEKVQLMSALASIATDVEVSDMLKSKPGGELVYGLFVEAVEKKLQEIMNGGNPTEDVPKNVINMLNATNQIDIALQEFKSVIISFMETPLIATLVKLNENLGGKPFSFDRSKIDNAPPAYIPTQPVRQQQRQQPIQQPQTQQQNQPPVAPIGYNPSDRSGGGVGSW